MRAVARALSRMPVLSAVSQTNPPKFERRRGAPLYDEEADAELLDTVVVDALVAGADVLNREVADVEVADAVVPIPRRHDKGIGAWRKSITELSESDESKFKCTSALSQ